MFGIVFYLSSCNLLEDSCNSDRNDVRNDDGRLEWERSRKL